MIAKAKLKEGSGKSEVKGAKAVITSNNGLLNINFAFLISNF
jgi:hypothetical protein